jgi:hypothetical protein
MSTPDRPVRASKLGAAVFGTGTPPATNNPDTSGDRTAGPGAPRRPRIGGDGGDKPAGGGKFTARFPQSVSVALDRVQLAAREQLGHRVDKIRIVESLILLVADDAALRDQVFAMLADAQQSTEPEQ